MDINDLIGYELICKISAELKDHPDYDDKEFSVVITEDSGEDSGYLVVVSGTDSDNKPLLNEWSTEDALNKFLFGDWIIKEKIKLLSTK